jgi:hypothetical protein
MFMRSTGFMTKNPARRLGCIDGEDSIRKHPFFKGEFQFGGSQNVVGENSFSSCQIIGNCCRHGLGFVGATQSSSTVQAESRKFKP